MRIFFVAGALLTLSAIADTGQTTPSAEQQALPTTMTRIVVRLSGGSVRPGSHAALPIKMYVANPHYARIEDPPDARLGVEKLIVIADPNAYNVNLVDHKGTHALDKGGPGDLHVPIVLPFDPKHRLGALDQVQFGEEFDGFTSAGAAHQAGPIINSKPTDAYVLPLPTGRQATLVLKSGTHIPIKLTWSDDDGRHTYEYIEYEDVPFDPRLFAKPENIRYREMPSDNGSSEQG
jgi:hypothetical protein